MVSETTLLEILEKFKAASPKAKFDSNKLATFLSAQILESVRQTAESPTTTAAAIAVVESAIRKGRIAFLSVELDATGMLLVETDEYLELVDGQSCSLSGALIEIAKGLV